MWKRLMSLMGMEGKGSSVDAQPAAGREQDGLQARAPRPGWNKNLADPALLEACVEMKDAGRLSELLSRAERAGSGDGDERLLGGERCEARGEDGRTALGEAAFWGCEMAVELLIEAGAELESRDNLGGTPFLAAACSNNVGCMERLLEAGANCKARQYDSRGVPAGPSGVEIAAFWAADKALEKLLSLWAIDLTGEEGCRAARAAVEGLCLKSLGHGGGERAVECLRVLVEKGCALGAGYADGKSALHMAAESGEARMVEMLIRAGADARALDAGGLAPWQLVDRYVPGAVACSDLFEAERARLEAAELTALLPEGGGDVQSQSGRRL